MVTLSGGTTTTDGGVVPPSTFLAGDIRGALPAKVILSETDVAPVSLAQNLLPCSDISDGAT